MTRKRTARRTPQFCTERGRAAPPCTLRVQCIAPMYSSDPARIADVVALVAKQSPKTQMRNRKKGGFSKGGFCRVQCHAQGNKKYPGALGPAVHLPLRAPQPREAYIFAKPPLKNPLSWFLTKGPGRIKNTTTY